MISPAIQQLQSQQNYLTEALRAMLEGQWCGAPPSTQAFVSALDPTLMVDCIQPVLHSDEPPPPPDYLAYYEPTTYMPRQQYSWSCSACALAWCERAIGLNDEATEESEIAAIGYPDNINASYGLMNGSGIQLQRVLREYGQDSRQDWLTFDSAYAIYSETPGMMSGGDWYHWVGVRGVQGDALWIANSAPGYRGVGSVLNRADFQRLGPFSAIWTVP